MKQKDIALIIVIIFVSGVISFLISSKFFGSSGNHTQEAETVDTITAQFLLPDPRYFNEQANNPTQLIQIGGGQSNQQPFSGNANAQ